MLDVAASLLLEWHYLGHKAVRQAAPSTHTNKHRDMKGAPLVKPWYSPSLLMLDVVAMRGVGHSLGPLNFGQHRR